MMHGVATLHSKLEPKTVTLLLMDNAFRNRSLPLAVKPARMMQPATRNTIYRQLTFLLDIVEARNTIPTNKQ